MKKKNIKLLLILITLAGLLLACKPTPPPPPLPPTGPPPKPDLFYGNHFSVRHLNYETLMASCRRCGTNRLIHGVYQKLFTFKNHPVRCKNWNSMGYIQIYFHGKELPTKTVITIWPRYNSTERWNKAFSIKSTAHPINQNQGFEILLTPKDGLGGVNLLKIKSENTNLFSNSLDIKVEYAGTLIIDQKIEQLSKSAVKEEDIINCDTYSTSLNSY